MPQSWVPVSDSMAVFVPAIQAHRPKQDCDCGSESFPQGNVESHFSRLPPLVIGGQMPVNFSDQDSFPSLKAGWKAAQQIFSISDGVTRGRLRGLDLSGRKLSVRRRESTCHRRELASSRYGKRLSPG